MEIFIFVTPLKKKGKLISTTKIDNYSRRSSLACKQVNLKDYDVEINLCVLSRQPFFRAIIKEELIFVIDPN